MQNNKPTERDYIEQVSTQLKSEITEREQLALNGLRGGEFELYAKPLVQKANIALNLLQQEMKRADQEKGEIETKHHIANSDRIKKIKELESEIEKLKSAEDGKEK